MNYRDIITIEPGKRGGKPCISPRLVDPLSDLFSESPHVQELAAEFLILFQWIDDEIRRRRTRTNVSRL